MKDKIERFYDEIFEHTSECWTQSNESGKCICKKEKFLYLLKEMAGEQIIADYEHFLNNKKGNDWYYEYEKTYEELAELILDSPPVTNKL